MRTHTIEGNEYYLDGSTNCPSKLVCDRRDNESYDKYIARHANEHGLPFPKQTAKDDIERNLAMWCGYYLHKYIIGNKTLCPEPFWEIHEFVWNWEFHPDDLDMAMWEKDERGLIVDGCTFELKPFEDRLPGVYKRFKEVELPRGTQKTSTVSKAYVTGSHLRQRYVFDNIYHRIIITSATTTLTEGVTNALKSVWEKNQNIKRLFGIDRFRTKVVRGQEVKTLLRRDGIYGSKTKNSLMLRWTKDADDATGLNAFSVMYAGIKTETQGQRADEYVFDDGNTKKNSRNQARREEVVETFCEQVNQLDPTGRLLVCNTRQHFDDFGGKIKSKEYRRLFHIMHRRAWKDAPDGTRTPFYPIDGTSRERYSLKVLDEMRLLKPEHEFFAEFMNCPIDPAKQLFKHADFQIVPNDARLPIEIRAGLGRPITNEEQAELDRKRARVRAFNTCDPAGKEEQSIKGDDTAAGGFRFAQNDDIYVTWLDCGQWDSDAVWDHLLRGYVRNRPFSQDYEKPASEMHIRAAFEAWKARRSAQLATPINMMLDLHPMPKSGKPHRIEQLTGWTKNKKVYILADAAPEDVIKKFVNQHVGYPMETHDDFPDMFSRVLRFAQPLTMEKLKEAEAQKEGPRITDGSMKVTFDQFMKAFEGGPTKTANWGLQGGKRRVA